LKREKPDEERNRKGEKPRERGKNSPNFAQKRNKFSEYGGFSARGRGNSRIFSAILLRSKRRNDPKTPAGGVL
jgi:hypothetical protein